MNRIKNKLFLNKLTLSVPNTNDHVSEISKLSSYFFVFQKKLTFDEVQNLKKEL